MAYRELLTILDASDRFVLSRSNTNTMHGALRSIASAAYALGAVPEAARMRWQQGKASDPGDEQARLTFNAVILQARWAEYALGLPELTYGFVMGGPEAFELCRGVAWQDAPAARSPLGAGDGSRMR